MQTIIGQADLRDRGEELLKRAEAGEQFLVMAGDRPVAQLGPVRPQRWVRDRRPASALERAQAYASGGRVRT